MQFAKMFRILNSYSVSYHETPTRYITVQQNRSNQQGDYTLRVDFYDEAGGIVGTWKHFLRDDVALVDILNANGVDEKGWD